MTISKNLKFSITNNPETLPSFKLNIALSNPTAGWILKEAGVVVADASGSTVPNITVSATTSAATIKFDNSGNTTEYELIGGATRVKFQTNGVGMSTPYGTVTINSFGVFVDRYIFDLLGVNLTVPNYLPPNITNTVEMFYNCSLFNSDIGAWDVSNVTNMYSMFQQCLSFNQDIGAWDVSNVTNMFGLLYGAAKFNQDISAWNVGSVKDMSRLFSNCSSFNQDISAWDVSNVTDMDYMFQYCSVFNQDLSQWCVVKTPSAPRVFSNGSDKWILPKPIWGTCPRGENLAT